MKQHGAPAAARLFGLEHQVRIHGRAAVLAAIAGGLLIAGIVWLGAPTRVVPPAAPGLGVPAGPAPSPIPDPPAPPEIPVSPTPTLPPPGELAPAPPEAGDDMEGRVFELTNALRARSGLPPLARDASLEAAARAYSQDMLQRGFFAHVDPDGRGPAERVARISGLPPAAVGENIWMWTGSSRPALQKLAEQAVAAWAASPSHRENILRRGYTRLGVGAAWAAGEVRLTQLFRE
jgi:uncharacterized protein YkwD